LPAAMLRLEPGGVGVPLHRLLPAGSGGAAPGMFAPLPRWPPARCA
jgi:hypothetical protein